MAVTRYVTNNSGGDWWLGDMDWEALEEKGWKVDWVKDQTDRPSWFGEGGRWLGALATQATRELPLAEAIAEWEEVTGQSADYEGCPCCGRPHEFYEEDA